MSNMLREQFSKHFESHDCSPTTAKDESQFGRHEFLSTNFQSDIPVEDSDCRKGRRDQVREHAELHGLLPHNQSTYIVPSTLQKRQTVVN